MSYLKSVILRHLRTSWIDTRIRIFILCLKVDFSIAIELQKLFATCTWFSCEFFLHASSRSCMKHSQGVCIRLASVWNSTLVWCIKIAKFIQDRQRTKTCRAWLTVAAGVRSVTCATWSNTGTYISSWGAGCCQYQIRKIILTTISLWCTCLTGLCWTG